MNETEPQTGLYTKSFEIRIYDYGGAPLGEPSKSRLLSLKSTARVLVTTRIDGYSSIFVRCRISGEIGIVVIRFGENPNNRILCQPLRRWDPGHLLLPVPTKE